MSRRMWQVAASTAALCVAFVATQAFAAINVQVLSSMPQLVSGGDALVKITGATAAPTITVGGTDVSAAFKGDATKGWVGLVTGLEDGDNALVAKAGADTANVTLVNHGINGVLFAGPKQQPFLCETEGLKLGKAKDADCAADTQVSYSYMSNKDMKWHDFDPKGTRPTDIADTGVGASRVPQIVRIERGVINRAGYVISMLHDPAAGALPTPDNQAANKGWNGKLIYAFGGGVQANYHQSLSTGLNATNTGASIMNDHLIQLGYALASGTLNVFGNNNNYITSAETAYKVKEHFIEEFGPPVFTIGYGPSGGSMQQDLIGNNYPGLLDGTIPERLYADTMTFLQPLYDCELLQAYFNKADPNLGWTDARRTAVSGMATYGYCTSNGTRYPNARPTNCNAAVTDAIANDPAWKGKLVRCTFQDNNVQAFGTDAKTGFAKNPFDNVGIQYGLKALNEGKITMDQFIDLNKNIGGMDVDGKVVAARQVGDADALKAAYATGQVNEAGAGYNTTPILDIRTWIDITTGPNTNLGNIDVHNSAHSLILRARMVKSNGNADNMATIITAEGNGRGEGSIIQTVELKYLTYLDKWITDIQADKRSIPQAQKVRENRPSEMANACYQDQYSRITDWDECMKLFPYSGHPRIAAGGPQTDDVFKCQVKPIDAKDYKTAPSAAQMDALKAAFPQGVCDYTKPAVGQVPLAGTWLMFQGEAKTISLASAN
jgi:hypothetical protein